MYTSPLKDPFLTDAEKPWLNFQLASKEGNRSYNGITKITEL